MTTYLLTDPKGETLLESDMATPEDARSHFWHQWRDRYFPKNGQRPELPCHFHEAIIKEA